MSWSKRSIIAACLFLAGCGFSPVHNGTAGKLNGNVHITGPETVIGYHMVSELDNKLGHANNPAYSLIIGSITVESDASMVTIEEGASRYHLTGTATWTLLHNGQHMARDTANAFVSYSASSTPIANNSARRNAIKRLATGLAQRSITQIQMALP